MVKWKLITTGNVTKKQAFHKKHEEALKEDAKSRIFKMIKEGYYQGELNTSVRYGKDIVPEEDEDDGLTYSGWWSVSYGA